MDAIVLTDLRLRGNSAERGSHFSLQRSVSYTSNLILSPEDNVFSLGFAALSYCNPATNRYRYKLEALEPYWIEVGSDRSQATYTTLPAGKYTFRVQGATSGGAWSEPGVAVSIQILPPVVGNVVVPVGLRDHYSGFAMVRTPSPPSTDRPAIQRAPGRAHAHRPRTARYVVAEFSRADVPVSGSSQHTPRAPRRGN